MRTVFLSVLLVLVLAARAAAAPFVVGAGSRPDVAVDASGVAHIAWTGRETGSPPHYCRLPRGATACDVALTLPVTPGTDSVYRPVVHVSGARVSVLASRYGQQNAIVLYTSVDGGATFAAPRTAGYLPIYESAFGPGDSVSVVSNAETGGTRFLNVPLSGTPPLVPGTLDTARPAYATVGLDGAAPVVIAEDLASNGAFRRYTGAGDVNAEANWSAPVPIGYLDYPRLAGGTLGLWVLAGDESGTMFVRRFDGAGFGARVPVASGDASEAALFQDAGGRIHAVFPRLDASGYHGLHAVSDDGVSWRVGEIDAQPFDEQGAMRVSAAADHVGVAVWSAAGPQIKASAIGPDASADPVPESGKTVVVRVVSGVVRVRLRGSSRFVDLRTLDDIPLGSTVDTKRGRIELRAVNRRGGPVETVQLYKGIFRVSQSRGVTDFALTEALAPCSKRARAAASKSRTRRLWGDGKGSFRTSGKYSAATVRGTRWLVADACTGTLTRVAQGAVAVRDKVKGRTIVLRAPKSYTARPRRR